jgi:hypothetical protein
MAKKADSDGNTPSRGAGRKPAKEKVAFLGYLNYTMPKDMAQDFEYQVSQGAVSLALLDDLLASGISISQKWDDYNESYSASAFDNRPDSPSAGYALTVHSSTPTRSLYKLLYGHYFALRCDWTSLGGRKREEEW